MGCPRVCGPKDWGTQWLGRPPRVGVPESLWTHGLGFPVVGETPKGWGAREFVAPRIGVPSGWGA